MQVTVSQEKESEEWVYPCLVKSHFGSIILAIEGDGDKFYGLCLNGVSLDSSDVDIRYINWEKENFKPFKGSVTISNS